MSVKVKICGITSVADGLAAAEAGADMIGLMFYEGSPRHLSFATATEIARALPPFIVKVGVFVNPRWVQVLAWCVAVVIGSLNGWLLIETFRGWL